MEGTGEGCGFLCSPKLPFLSLNNFVADCGSTLLAFRPPGFILCLPVLLFHVLSLITMPFILASLSLNLFLVALADRN